MAKKIFWVYLFIATISLIVALLPPYDWKNVLIGIGGYSFFQDALKNGN